MNQIFKRPAKIRLTIPQHRIFSKIIDDGVRLGDCKLVGLTLQFDDYEGANAVLKNIMSVSLVTTRDWVTSNSVITRLNAAIREAAK